MNLRIERIALQGPSLARSYVESFSTVAHLYASGAPNRIESYRDAVERIRGEYPAERWERLSPLLEGSRGELRARLARLIEQRGVFVTTGQQAGLFLGPLYTLYKALSAVRLARELESRLGIPTLPLFVVASDDHDWAEVNHTHVIDVENHLVRVAVTRPEIEAEDSPNPPLERIEVGAEIDAALQQLAQATPDTEFKPDVLESLRGAYAAGRTYPEAFRRLLDDLLGRLGLASLRMGEPWLKQRGRDLLWSEWERGAESEERLLQRSREIGEAGFESQVPITRGTTNLFLDGPLGRDRLLRENGTARLRRTGDELSEDRLQAILGETPERLSPGALLRPVVEAAVLPVAAYVAGPSEIAYLAQSHALFRLHGVPAPVVVPRAAFHLIEAKVDRVLDKYGIAPSELAGNAEAAISRQIQAQAPAELVEALHELKRAAGAALERVESTAVEFDPGSRSAVGSGKQAVFAGISTLEDKLEGRIKEKHQVMRQQLEKVAVNLFPAGRSQERLLNPFPFLVRYGRSLLERIYAEVVTPLS